MGDPRRQLLQRGEHHAVERALFGELGVPPAQRLIHAPLLERLGVAAARHGEVVADHDRVTTFLRGPTADPLAPRLFLAEGPPQRQVVVGQVVLGEQVDLQRRLRDVGQPRVLGSPWLLHEVPPLFVRDVVVREPLVGGTDMPIEGLLDQRHELMEHDFVRYGAGFRHVQISSVCPDPRSVRLHRFCTGTSARCLAGASGHMGQAAPLPGYLAGERCAASAVRALRRRPKGLPRKSSPGVGFRT